MKCSKCGAVNRKGVAFCTHCGEAVSRAGRNTGKAKSNISTKAVVAVFGAAALVLIFALKQESNPTRPTSAESFTATPIFGQAVNNLAAKFYCSCGSCDVPELVDCTCPTAIKEKTLIDQELKRGTSEEKVLALLNDRYGKIKPQFASLIGGYQAPDPVMSKQVIDPLPLSVGTIGSKQVALESDLKQIASHFICACGQCQDHVLAECECDHPRGAAEMKAFIKYKISQKTSTLQEVVEAVAYEYGHRLKSVQ